MKLPRPVWICLALALLGTLSGFFLSGVMPWREGDAGHALNADKISESPPSDVRLNPAPDAAPSELSAPEGTIPGERVVHFDTQKAYKAFLKALHQAGFEPLGQIDELRVLRIPEAALRHLAPGAYGARANYAYRVEQPPLPERVLTMDRGPLQAYGAPARAISGGGLPGDGSGVLVAILDSGIHAHPQFDATDIVNVDLAGGGVSASGAAHGTSVASIISGREGIAPEAALFMVRVLDDLGQGNSFHVAEGIVRATDLGAQIINMSLGLYEDAPVVRRAVQYAAERGVVLVAAAGNDGLDQIPFPAAYDAVLSVTATDARGTQAGFPNQSPLIDLAAPGIGIETAKEAAGTTLFSGTSAAAPFVSGTLASLMSGEQALGPNPAVELLQRYLNDAGAPGPDPQYGAGVLDWDRLRERETKGILDLALADLYLDPALPPGTTQPVEVTVQNRGTRWLNQAELEVAVGDRDPIRFSIGTLGPGQITTRKIYAQIPGAASGEGLRLAARVLPEAGEADVRWGNNLKAVQFRAK